MNQVIGQTPAGVRVELLVTAASHDSMFTNNVWLVGTDEEVIVVDAAHDASAIVSAVGGRSIVAVACTHAHWDHVNALADLRARCSFTALVHPGDGFLWDETVPFPPDGNLADGLVLTVGDIELTVHHTPGHTPGSCVLHAPSLDAVFVGDTLFPGGPGATRWDYSSFPTIIESISERLFVLPDHTVVLPGHGDTTQIGVERPSLPGWVARGW